MQPTLKDWLNRGRASPKKRKGLLAMSKKRKGDARVYSKKRRAFLEANRYCQAFWRIVNHTKRFPMMGGFYGSAPATTEIHHTKKPKCKYLNDESTWLAVCRWSHDWIEDHKSTAREIGLLQ
jgi:hypothetical protein